MLHHGAQKKEFIYCAAQKKSVAIVARTPIMIEIHADTMLIVLMSVQ